MSFTQSQSAQAAAYEAALPDLVRLAREQAEPLAALMGGRLGPVGAINNGTLATRVLLLPVLRAIPFTFRTEPSAAAVVSFFVE